MLCELPAVIVGNQLIRCPCSRRGSISDETCLIDLEEFESGFIDRRAISIAVRKVIDDRAVMRIRPGVPLHHNRSAGFDRSGELSIGGTPMADDVTAGEGTWSNKSKIGCSLSPADGSRGVGFVRVLGHKVSSVAVRGQPIPD